MVSVNKRGSLIVVSGPSGAGKDSVCQELLKKNKNIWISISCTTREPRNGEVDGRDYFFLSKEEFETRIKNDDFLEYATYNDNYYGTPRSVINEYLNKGIDVILIIEVQGALIIKEKIKEAIFVFIMPPSMKELKRRLINRNTETLDKVLSRFKRAYQEINEISKYNYIVVNNDIVNASDDLNAIIRSEKLRVDRIEDLDLNSEEELMHEFFSDIEK